MADFQVLGKSHIRVDALEKVTGKATYAGDVALPGMLMCKVLTSTQSHATIVSIDASAAEALPGVRSVITGKDYPDAWFGSGALKDRRIMARDEVFYIGEPVAAVAADDEVTASEALDLIKVEYKDLEKVVDPLQAISGKSVEIHPDMEGFEGYGFALGGNNCTMLDADRGDVDQGFKDSDVIVEETYHTQPISQGFLEPMACVAHQEANGRLTIWASTQGPYQVRAQLASVLDIPLSSIKVIAMEITHESHIEEIDNCLEKLGRPTGVMLQVGTRNTQNFELLKAIGRQSTYPVLLKRGFGITLNESLNAAWWC